MSKSKLYKINQRLDVLGSIKDISWFLILFLFFEFIWKVCVHQGEDESILIVLGKDMTSWAYPLSRFTAKTVYWVIHDLFGYSDFQVDGILLYFKDSLFKTNIVWGCVGVKQLLMFTFIILFYFGPLKKKIWFIPLFILVLILINILRITIICFITKNPFPEWFIGVNTWYNNRIWINNKETFNLFYQDWFNVFHHDIFTWIYYDGILFLIWLFWEERFNKPYRKLTNKIKSDSQA